MNTSQQQTEKPTVVVPVETGLPNPEPVNPQVQPETQVQVPGAVVKPNIPPVTPVTQEQTVLQPAEESAQQMPVEKNQITLTREQQEEEIQKLSDGEVSSVELANKLTEDLANFAKDPVDEQ